MNTRRITAKVAHAIAKVQTIGNDLPLDEYVEYLKQLASLVPQVAGTAAHWATQGERYTFQPPKPQPEQPRPTTANL